MVSHWSIIHIGKRFLFSQVSSWWFLLNLKKQCSAEEMYSLIRKVSLHSQVTHLNCFLITAWLRGIEFFCLSMVLMKSILWVLSACGSMTIWLYPWGFASNGSQRHNIWHSEDTSEPHNQIPATAGGNFHPFYFELFHKKKVSFKNCFWPP